MKDRSLLIEQIDKFFEVIGDKPEGYNLDELITITEAIIPVHADLEVTNYDEVDVLLAVYPYLYQKLVKIFAYFAHQVRIATREKQSHNASYMRSYRDAFEQLMRAVKLQYETLSRRITINIDRR